MNEAIKLAIEKGGYLQGKIHSSYDIFDDGIKFVDQELSENCRCNGLHGMRGTVLHKLQIVTDPLFWQALGKALGWARKAEGENLSEVIKYGEDIISWVCRYCGTDAQTDEEHGDYGSILSSWFVCYDCKGEELENEDQFIPKHIYHGVRYQELVLTGGDVEAFWKELLK